MTDLLNNEDIVFTQRGNPTKWGTSWVMNVPSKYKDNECMIIIFKKKEQTE